MREIKYITLHCTAGPQTQSPESIQNYWKNDLGWDRPGYHFMIKPDGTVLSLLDILYASYGVAGYNKNNLHISYIGGVTMREVIRNNKPINVLGEPIDNRTPEQLKSMIKLVDLYSTKFPGAIILGHRDFSVDKNRNGIIEPSEWMKTCPSFSTKDWLKQIGFKSKLPKTYYVTTTTVNIRAGAGVQFEKVATALPKGTEVQFIGDADEWYYVQVRGTEVLGYVAAQYLKKTGLF